MNKKILIFSILVFFILISISVVSSTGVKDAEKKESPLYEIRNNQAVSEKIGAVIENIKTKFLGERMFFLPIIRINRNLLQEKTDLDATYYLLCMKFNSFMFGQWCTEAGPTCGLATCDWGDDCSK